MIDGAGARMARVEDSSWPAGRVAAELAPLAALERVRLVGARLGLNALVAMPVRQEAHYLPRALAALGESLAALDEPAGIALFVNNTHDASADIACAFGARAGVPVFCFEATLAPQFANAGLARRLALDLGAAVADDDAVLLTTDADTVVTRGWARRLVAAVRGGAALAYGAIEADGPEFSTLPGPVRAMAEVEDALFAAQGALWQALLPGTSQMLGVRAGGAGMAIAARAYRRAGGLPMVPCGEDRAMVRALLARQERVAFAPDAQVRTSCRLASGTEGGMAATLARRAAGERFVDGDLLPAAAFVARALAFGHLAGLVTEGRTALERRLGVAPGRLRPDPALAGARWLALMDAIGAPAPMNLREAWRALEEVRSLTARLPAPAAWALAQADALAATAGRGRCNG